jgi:phosphoribosyl-ATP pyrophosphohydrolase/phosphoribosyl-AMP cyclohydrolase
MTPEQLNALDWAKSDGLLPAIVQHALNGQILMQGYMNREALQTTLSTGKVTFYSRSKQRLWTKGETSGNWLTVQNVVSDCDNDSLLVLAMPAGPTCHTGTDSCYGDEIRSRAQSFAFLAQLETVIAQRIAEKPEGSYTARLWSQGATRMAQKVGEEGVEVALAAATQADAQLVSESADLLYHLALVLKSRNLSLEDVIGELERRHEGKR